MEGHYLPLSTSPANLQEKLSKPGNTPRDKAWRLTTQPETQWDGSFRAILGLPTEESYHRESVLRGLDEGPKFGGWIRTWKLELTSYLKISEGKYLLMHIMMVGMRDLKRTHRAHTPPQISVFLGRRRRGPGSSQSSRGGISGDRGGGDKSHEEFQVADGPGRWDPTQEVFGIQTLAWVKGSVAFPLKVSPRWRGLKKSRYPP